MNKIIRQVYAQIKTHCLLNKPDFIIILILPGDVNIIDCMLL